MWPVLTEFRSESSESRGWTKKEEIQEKEEEQQQQEFIFHKRQWKLRYHK